MHFNYHDFVHLLANYGYWAVMLFVGIESTGVPFPGETMLLAAAIYAGTTHSLDITLIIAAATAGAILGDNLGYWIGREFGYELLLRYGRYIRFDEKKMKLGQYLFWKHGGKVVFFGRFVAVLRTFAALLAGINMMEWRRFLLFNCAGGVIWATIFGLAGYLFGRAAHRLFSELGLLFLGLAVVGALIGFVFVRRHQAQLEAAAEAHFPGPLEHHIGKGRRR